MKTNSTIIKILTECGTTKIQPDGLVHFVMEPAKFRFLVKRFRFFDRKRVLLKRQREAFEGLSDHRGDLSELLMSELNYINETYGIKPYRFKEHDAIWENFLDIDYFIDVIFTEMNADRLLEEKIIELHKTLKL